MRITGAPVSLQRLRITGGKSGGGGIYNNSQATVTLDASSGVTGNDAKPANPDAGGIFNDGGTVNLDNVSGNTPDNRGGSVPPLCVD